MLGGDRGGGEKGEQDLLGVGLRIEGRVVRVGPLGGFGRLEVVGGAAVDQVLDDHLANRLPVGHHGELPGISDSTDHRETGLPLLADLPNPFHLVGFDDRQHPFLGLGNHDLEGLHPGFAKRHLIDVDLDSDPAGRGHLPG